MNELLVQAESVSRAFPQGMTLVPAVVAASFAVHPGDRVALMGRSGSGKSCLLHLMAGLDTPTSGTIRWPALGTVESLLPGKIAIVFQAPSLLEPLTVRENVALPLLIEDVQGDVETAVTTALGTFGLTELARKLPEELSGGQMQRVAMARAIVGKPRLILADEPTGQLDQRTAHDLLDALFAHLADSKTALVIATHDPAIAARMEIVWQMERGVLSTSPRRSAKEQGDDQTLAIRPRQGT